MPIGAVQGGAPLDNKNGPAVRQGQEDNSRKEAAHYYQATGLVVIISRNEANRRIPRLCGVLRRPARKGLSY